VLYLFITTAVKTSNPTKMYILYMVLLRKFNDGSLDGTIISSEMTKILERENLMERDQQFRSII
jgi:hypothetical protein